MQFVCIYLLLLTIFLICDCIVHRIIVYSSGSQPPFHGNEGPVFPVVACLVPKLEGDCCLVFSLATIVHLCHR